VSETILDEANRIAGECRSRDYGHPLDNHERIAAIWNVQLGPKLSAPISAVDVAILMVGLKLARLVNSPNHRDSLVDAAGYIKCADMIQTELDNRRALHDKLCRTMESDCGEVQSHPITATQATATSLPSASSTR